MKGNKMQIEKYKCIQCNNEMYSRDNVKEIEDIPQKMTYSQIADDADDPYGYGSWDFDVYIPSMRTEMYEKIKASTILQRFQYGVICYHSKESAIKASKILFNL